MRKSILRIITVINVASDIPAIRRKITPPINIMVAIVVDTVFKNVGSSLHELKHIAKNNKPIKIITPSIMINTDIP